MKTIRSSRRTTLKLLLAGSVVSLGTACNTLQSLPRGRSGGSTDGQELSLRVQDALRNHPDTATLSLNITTTAEGDEVVLKGFAPNDADVYNAEIVAGQVAGVRHVIMNVFVQ